jgi:hypothetical protein
MAENTDQQKSLFRDKNIERMESPEKLNDYLRVTSPGVWLVLGAVISLLVGVCIWGMFGTIRSTTPAAVVGGDGQNVCYVPASALEGVLANKTVTVNGKDLELAPSVLEPQVVSTDMDVYVLLAGRLSVGDIVYPIPLAGSMESGVYTGQLLTETMSPMSLFFN